MPQKTIFDQAVALVTDTAPIQLEAIADGFTQQQRNDMARELEAIAAYAAFAAGYLASRSGEGCGDQGHAAALKAANRARRLTRGAFGYTTTPPFRM